MKKSLWISTAVIGTAVAAGIALGPGLGADGDLDWGRLVQRQLNERSQLLFGVRGPLAKSALGPYTDADSTQAIRVAEGLKVSLVSSAVGSLADMIALWPTDRRPTHLFVCVETSTNAIVQRVDLSQPPESNATTILSGLVS